MSWLDIRGEITRCSKCKKNIVICEFKGGNRSTQIGDEKVYMQKKWNKKYNPFFYNPKKFGYYYYSYQSYKTYKPACVCEDCLAKMGNKILKIDNNFYYLQWRRKHDEIFSYDQNYLRETMDDICKNLSVDLLQQVTPEAYEIMINKKTGGSKKEFNRILKTYAESTSRMWVEYAKECVRKYKKDLANDSEYIDLCIKVREFAETNTLSIYSLVTYDKPLCLNDYIENDDTVREYEKVNKKCNIYAPVWFDANEIRDALDWDPGNIYIENIEYDFSSMEHMLFRPLRELMKDKIK